MLPIMSWCTRYQHDSTEIRPIMSWCTRYQHESTEIRSIISWCTRYQHDSTKIRPIMSWCTRYQHDSTEIRHVCLPHVLRTSVYMMHLAQEVNHAVFVGIVSNTSIKLSFWLKIWSVLTFMPVTARRKTDVQIHLDNMLSMYIYTWKWDYSVLKPLYNKHFTYFYSRIHWLSIYISWRAKRMFVFLN